jgi:tRNA(Leu) C34 or U34 (ribose-2'-O)-methylase TrmL
MQPSNLHQTFLHPLAGNESHGLSRAVLDNPLVTKVHVPTEPGIESLNLAACGSLIMFEALRQQKRRFNA